MILLSRLPIVGRIILPNIPVALAGTMQLQDNFRVVLFPVSELIGVVDVARIVPEYQETGEE